MGGPHADERTHVLDDPLGQVFEELAQLRGEYTARLAALEEENGRLRARMAVLERPPARRDDGEASVAGVDAPEPDLSRRSLLRRVGAATAIGTGVAVGTSLLGATPASAGTDGDVVLGGTRAVNNAGSAITEIWSTSDRGTLNVFNELESASSS